MTKRQMNNNNVETIMDLIARYNKMQVEVERCEKEENSRGANMFFQNGLNIKRFLIEKYGVAVV